ncbi:hypothetical protein CkaCkLH20_00265 [Colletotrichum karsti]|uniref:Integral membrane protein n=1 Tax=Colletotrichum karsti TaxID=1095194 RepID=A0A9P6IG35_9PEZI|nr:uncharacterized protein CkaCkLH20_00265 [Colletotrichum karsti]KAF9882229.1 hypothetical protein CkaCkLH20_00265 [Colletotrichum karsti]
MERTGIQSHASPEIEPRQIEDEDEDFHERPVGKPRMTMDGAPNEVFWICPAPAVIEYESDWYCLPDLPDFLICTNCQHKYLAETDLSNLLERTRRPTGRCRFNVPRLTRALLPAYRKTGDLKPIRDFMKRRLSVQDCHGEAGVKGEAGVVWYKPLDDRLLGMLSCEACYEDVILAASFRGNWGPYDRAHAAGETWACDVALRFIRRISEKFPVLPGRTWEDWACSAANHMNQPTCQWGDDNMSSSSRKWVRLRGGRVPSIRTCEKCYEEQFAFTALSREFEFIPPEDTAMHGPDPWYCSMKDLPVLLAAAMSIPPGDVDSFVPSAELIAANPRCTHNGIRHGTWYTLAGGDVRDDFRICVSCYTALFKTAGLDRFFEQVADADGSSQALVACSFNRTAPRWRQQYAQVQEALQTGVWPRFSDWVRKYAGVPPCERDEEVDNRRWYGWDECTICPECWLSFCAESSSKLAVELHNQHVVGRRMCCMYSPLMRQKWLAACERGSADELVEYSRGRYRVYAQVTPQIQMLRSQHQMQVMQNISAGQTSAMYSRLAMHSSTMPSGMGYSSPYSYNNTDWGVKSAAYFSQMQAGTSQSNTTIYMIEDLRNQWRAVE